MRGKRKITARGKKGKVQLAKGKKSLLNCDRWLVVGGRRFRNQD